MKAGLRKLIVAFSLLVAITAQAQEKYIREGDKFFSQRMFPEAAESYKRSLQKIKPSREHYVSLQLARAYKSMFDYRNAAEWFAKIKDSKENEPGVYRDYGYVLLGLGEYDKAMEQFREYCSSAGKQDQLAKYEKLCAWPSSAEAQKQPKYNVYSTNLPVGNRALGMTWFNEGVIFSTPQQQDAQGVKTTYYDLAYAAINDSVSFGSPQVLSGVNRSFYDAAPAISGDGNTLYFTSNNTEETKYKPGNKKKNREVSSDGRNVLQVYYAIKQGSEWSPAEKASFDSIEFNYAFPFVTPDGNTLYFASDMPGGLGKMDIYRVRKTGNNQWSTPENLGPEVNTEEDDIYPYITAGKFYFSSRGREGYGGLDVYVADMSGEAVSAARNMGTGVNSTADDFAFILKEDMKTGYVSSNRGSFSSDAVYSLLRRPDTDTLRGIVTGDQENAPLQGVIVNLYRLDENNNKQLVKTITTGADGKWEFIVNPENKYKVEFETGGYDKKEIEMVASSNGSSNRNGNGNGNDSGSGPDDTGYGNEGEKRFRKDVLVSLSKTASADEPASGDLTYTVQIGAYRFPENFVYEAVKPMGPVQKKKLEDGITRFTVNSYNTIQEARALKDKIVAKGVSDAFVLAVYKGKRVYIVDLAKEGLLPLQ